jgi:hypothetical protein
MGSSSGGGDGGAAQAAQIKAEQDKSISELNKLFGVADTKSPTVVDRSKFYDEQTLRNMANVDRLNATGNGHHELSYTPIFQQEAYDKAVAAANNENALTKSMRESFYQKAGNDVFNLKKESLDKSKLNADRELKFQLARTGNFGGSNQIDQGNNVTDNYQRGLLDIGNLQQSTINNARANDETSRVDLIGRVRAGMNQADALNSAASQQQSNLAQARDNALAQTVTDYFGGMKYLQGQNQYQQDFATAQKKYGTQAKAFNGTVGTI